jgi:acid phosphatase family membrane protein YuiD
LLVNEAAQNGAQHFVAYREDALIHRVAVAALLAGLMAQALKVLIELARTRRLNLLRFFDNGGMPSSHTALVTTLTIGVARYDGVGSSLFAVTLLFSLYFMFEAAGLRQEVGNQARVLNDLADELRQTHHLDPSRLKELVGHTWGEVLGGLLFGLIVSAVAFR